MSPLSLYFHVKSYRHQELTHSVTLVWILERNILRVQKVSAEKMYMTFIGNLPNILELDYHEGEQFKDVSSKPDPASRVLTKF